jgi:Xaa-Pro aminopeptidase
MRRNNVNCYIIPTEDAHMSEYIAWVDKRREFISSFSGSAGTAVVTEDKALLWTDGRYYLQATNQLTKEWTLQRAGLPSTPTIKDWIASNLVAGNVVGIDGKLFTIQSAKEMQDTFSGKNIQLKHFHQNFIDEIWDDQPDEPSNPIKILDLKYAGKAFGEKIAELRMEIIKNGCFGAIITALDEICWLFNMRGSDIDFNPVFKAFAVITVDFVTLYVDHKKLSPEIKDYLKEIKLEEYGKFYSDLKELEGKMMINQKCSLAAVESLGNNYIIKPSPVEAAKAIKNDVELEGFRQCHRRDAVALV